MTNKKSTKKALISSVLALLLCVSMLIGATFAWFTDTVSSAKNQIVAGNLDVELEYAKVVNGTMTDWATVAGAADIFDPNALWEPGRVEVVYLKVSNLGTLALKYQLGVNVYNEIPGTNVANEEFKLSDYLVFKTVEMPDGLTEYSDREAALIASGSAMGLKDYNGQTTALEVGGVDYVALIVYMPETVGNVANYKTGTTAPSIELGVNLFATQQVAEEDSFGPDYDEDAWAEGMIVMSEADLLAALANGEDKIVLGTDIVSENGFTVTQDLAINLNGNTMTATGDRAYLFHVTGDADLTVVNGTLAAESTNGIVDGTGTSTGASSSIYFESTGNLTVENVDIQGSVRGGHRAVEVYNGTAVLTNVDITTAYGSGINSGSGANVTLNDCDITVTGMYSSPYNSVAFSVMGGAEMTINSGNYKMINNNTYATGDTHGGWLGIIMNSGGTMTINGGTYTNVPTTGFNASYERAILYAQAGTNAPATLVLNDGTFDPQATKSYELADGAAVVWNGNKLVDNGDGTYTVVPSGLSTVAGYSHLYTDGANGYYIYDLQGLKSLNNWVSSNMWNPYEKTYNVMADINAAGFTWIGKQISPNGDNTPGMTFNGNGHTISNLAITNGGLFSLAPNGTYATEPATFKDITFDNVTVTGGHHTGVVWGQVSGDLVLENVHVKNSNITGAYNVSGLAGSTGEFAVDASVKYVNCSVTNTTITANGAAGSDPTGASAFMGRALDNTYLVFEGNNVAENITYVNENGLVGGSIYGYTAYVGGGFACTGTCDTFENWGGIRAVGVTSASELTAATKDAKDGQTIVLLNDITENATAHQVVGVDVIIDGNGFTMSGTLFVDGRSDDTTGETMVIRNINFVTSTNEAVMIDNRYTATPSTRYGHHITIEKCTFTATGDAKYTAKAFEFDAPRDILIKDCTATGLHSLLWSNGYTGTEAFTVDGATMTDCKNGMSFGTNAKVVVKNCVIETVGNDSYGLRGDGAADNAYAMTVESCKITAKVPVQIRKMVANTNYTLTIQGDNKFVQTGSGYQIIITETEYADDVSELKHCAGTCTLVGADGYVVFK